MSPLTYTSPGAKLVKMAAEMSRLRARIHHLSGILLDMIEDTDDLPDAYRNTATIKAAREAIDNEEINERT